MKWIGYEILLPLCYNDGRPIETHKFRQTTLDLLERFSATTIDLMIAFGKWKYQGTIRNDLLWRFVVDVPVSEPADDFFRSYKEPLKTRFEQVDTKSTLSNADPGAGNLCDGVLALRHRAAAHRR